MEWGGGSPHVAPEGGSGSAQAELRLTLEAKKEISFCIEFIPLLLS